MSAGNRLHPWSLLLNFNYSHSCSSLLLNGSKVTKGQGMVTHQSQLYTSVQIKTSGFSPFHAFLFYEGTGIRFLFLFLAFATFLTLLGNNGPLLKGTVDFALPRLGKPFPHFPCFSAGTFLLYLPNVTGCFCFPQQPWVHFASAFHHDNIPEVRI